MASAAAYVESLNKLASTDLFIVVSETTLNKTGDQLARLISGASAEQEPGAEKKEPATMSHVERMVTNPDLNPPVRVKLVLDVYSFKGV